MLYKGDDGACKTAGASVDKERVLQLRDFTNLEFTAKQASSADFCGYLITDECFVPNLYRLFLKITGFRARNFQHFQSYQQSVADQLDMIYSAGLEKFVFPAVIQNRQRTDVVNWPVSVEEAEAVWRTCCAWATCSEKEWIYHTQEYEDCLTDLQPSGQLIDIKGDGKMTFERKVLFYNPS